MNVTELTTVKPPMTGESVVIEKTTLDQFITAAFDANETIPWEVLKITEPGPIQVALTISVNVPKDVLVEATKKYIQKRIDAA